MANPYGLRLKRSHSALIEIRLETPNVIPLALIGPFLRRSANNKFSVNRPKGLTAPIHLDQLEELKA